MRTCKFGAAAQMTRFLPAMGADYFYLFVKDVDKPETLFTQLRKPFKSFADQTWLFIVGIMIVVGVTMTVIELLEGKIEEGHTIKGIALRTSGNIYRSFAGFVGGGSHADESAATKSLVFGFRFFLMLTLSAYVRFVH